MTRTEIEELRNRRDDITEMIAEERDKETPDQTRIDDLIAERASIEDRIEDIEALAEKRQRRF